MSIAKFPFTHFKSSKSNKFSILFTTKCKAIPLLIEAYYLTRNRSYWWYWCFEIKTIVHLIFIRLSILSIMHGNISTMHVLRLSIKSTFLNIIFKMMFINQCLVGRLNKMEILRINIFRALTWCFNYKYCEEIRRKKVFFLFGPPISNLLKKN